MSRAQQQQPGDPNVWNGLDDDDDDQNTFADSPLGMSGGNYQQTGALGNMTDDDDEEEEILVDDDYDDRGHVQSTSLSAGTTAAFTTGGSDHDRAPQIPRSGHLTDDDDEIIMDQVVDLDQEPPPVDPRQPMPVQAGQEHYYDNDTAVPQDNSIDSQSGHGEDGFQNEHSGHGEANTSIPNVAQEPPQQAGMEASGITGAAAVAATVPPPPDNNAHTFQQAPNPYAPEASGYRGSTAEQQPFVEQSYGQQSTAGVPPPPPPYTAQYPPGQEPAGYRASGGPPPPAYAGVPTQPPPVADGSASYPDPQQLAYPRDVEAPMHGSGMVNTATVDRSVLSDQEKRSRCTVTWLLITLGCLLVCVAALAGGITGALLFNRPPPVPATPAPTLAPVTAAPTFTVTSSPSMAPVTSVPTVPGATGAPTAVATTAPVAAVATDAPTPGGSTGTPTATTTTAAPVGGIVTNQTLYDVISGFAPDGGASILQAGTPQSTAYLSVQSEQADKPLPDDRMVQRYAMRVFFYSTSGPAWTNNNGWTTTLDECLWYSSFANPTSICEGDTLLILEMADNNVGGTLPPELGMLSSLTRLSVKATPDSGVGLEGNVPIELAQLPLTVLVLNDQLFKSALPEGLFDNWNLLKVATLINSQLTGAIPATTNLIAASNLNLEGNQLSGPLPAGLGNMRQLVQLNLANNTLSGPIPETIGQLDSLKGLALGNNQLTGAIPTTVGQMTSLRTHFDLAGNSFSGNIPAELNNVPRLIKIHLNDNALTGAVPDLAALVELTEFFIQNNALTGAVSDSTCAALVNAVSSADCGANANPQITCSCCTNCCDGGGAACGRRRRIEWLGELV